MLNSLISVAFNAQTRLGSYFRSMHDSSKTDATIFNATVGSQNSAVGLLPCPPPAFPDPKEILTVSSPRIRRRVQTQRVVQQLVALQVGSLSFQAQGCPDVAPVGARVGDPISAAQQRLIDRLTQKTKRVVRVLTEFRLDEDCGRKAQGVLSFLSELGERTVSQSYDGGPVSASARRAAPREVDVERLDLPPPGRAGSFTPDPFLREDVRAAFVDPELLRYGVSGDNGFPADVRPPRVAASDTFPAPPKYEPFVPQPECEKPARWERDLRGSAGTRPHTERASVRECDKHLQPEGDFAYLHKPAGRPPRARHYVRKEDDVALLERFDCAGMLEFALASEIDRRFVAGIFPVAKSATRDRPITNRRPRNAVERSVGASAELFPHGSVLTELQVPPGARIRGSGDDLPDFYHTVRVGLKRARTNAFGRPVRFEQIAHLEAGKRLLSRYPGISGSTLVYALQSTLPMGDRNATDFAQLAHLGVLRQGNALAESGYVSYRSAPPAGDLWQFVMIDDHIVVQVYGQPSDDTSPPEAAPAAEPARAPGDVREDEALLERVAAAYAEAGLEPKPSKRFRFEPVFNVLGARVDGREPWVSAKPELLLVGLALAAGIVAAGSYTGGILSSTVACWVQILLYRRAGFCLLDRVYQEVAAAGADGAAWHRLPAAAADELLMVALNVASWGTDLSAPVSTELFCTDAAGGRRAGAAGVRSVVPSAVAQELWRHRCRRGGYVRMETDGEAAARRLEDYFGGAGNFDYAAPLRGDSRWFGDVCDALGWQPTFAYQPAAAHINIQELRAVRTLVRRQARASKGPSRQLVGIDSNVVIGALAKGRSSSRRLNRVLRSFVAEQLFAEVYIGALGVPSKQNPADSPSRRRATRREPEPIVPEWAERFVQGAVGALAAILRPDERFDWLIGTRVGEAKNPGPRDAPFARPTDVNLLERPSLAASTKRHRVRLVDELRKFASARGADLAAAFAAGSEAVVQLLRVFGQSLYSSNRSLGDYRETINGVVDLRREWRTAMSGAWDVVTEWQMYEPIDHHIPLPKSVFRALFVVALLARDVAFAVVLFAGFVGGLRPGEATSLRRRDVLLPADLGQRSGSAFLVIRDPRKARRRGVRAQHVTIDDAATVAFLAWALAGLEPDAPIWDASPAVFAKRWTLYVGGILGLPVAAADGFTPASMRAGSATEMYQQTRDLVRVQWHLRHKDIETLRHYVQELPLAMSRAALTPTQFDRVQAFARVADVMRRRALAGHEVAPLVESRWAVVRARPRRRRSAPARPRTAL